MQQSQQPLKTAQKPQETSSSAQTAQSHPSEIIYSDRKSLPCSRCPSWAFTPCTHFHRKPRSRWPLSSRAKLPCLHIIRWDAFASSQVRLFAQQPRANHPFPDDHCLRETKVQTIPDRQRPETWTFIPSLTIRREGDYEFLATPAEIRRVWDQYAESFAEPFRSALLSLPGDAVIWCERLAHWPTVQWENRGGRVTLAGDAAHPMTYRT